MKSSGGGIPPGMALSLTGGNIVSQAEDAIADTSLNLAFSEDVSAGLVISGSIGAKIYLPVVLAP